MTKTYTKTILAIGDWHDYDAFKKFYRERRLANRLGVGFESVNYKDLLSGKAPDIDTQEILVFLFFPYDYWDKRIETKKYAGIYGNKKFYDKFKKMWKRVDSRLKRDYAGKDLYFINPPHKVGAYRDKMLSKKIMSNARLRVSRPYRISNPYTIYKDVNKGHKLFIKVRYGSMGKGISYLEKDNWITNFLYKNKKILNRKGDSNWHFIDVTNDRNFLKALLKGDMIVEHAVESMIVKNRIFDLRVYVFDGKVLFIYPRSNKHQNHVTNISQGGRGERSKFLELIPRKLVASAKKKAIRAVKALDVNFAAVDIMIDKNRKDLYIIETNFFPGFPRRRIFNMGKFLMEKIARSEWSEIFK